MPTQIPSTGRPAATRSRSASSRPCAREPARGALDVPDAGDHGERRRRARSSGSTVIDGSAPARASADADASGGCRRRSRRARPSRDRPSSSGCPPPPGATACRSACPSALNAASATWWSSAPAASTCTVQPASHREALERVREQRHREPADAVAREGERDLGVRAAHEVDGRRRPRLVHRHDGRAVAGDALAGAERLRERRRRARRARPRPCGARRRRGRRRRRSSRSKPAWKASSVRRWSRKPMPVATRDAAAAVERRA